MDFEEREQKALAIMASRKMWKSNYAPPLICLLWWLGVKIPPLPFASFWRVFVLMTVSFSVISLLFTATLFWLLQWRLLLIAGVLNPLTGIIFGLTMALFHLWR